MFCNVIAQRLKPAIILNSTHVGSQVQFADVSSIGFSAVFTLQAFSAVPPNPKESSVTT